MPLRLGGRTLADGELAVMAIVNRTPDSFYDRGATFEDRAALDAVARAVDEGAAIVDIGGVKAGPGDPVDAAEEQRRVTTFVAAVRGRHPAIAISVDTWRHEVARSACAEGADLVNDAWGGVDPQLVDVAAEAGAGYVCTHAGGLAPRTRPHRVAYDDVVADILERTVALADRAVAAGVARDEVLIDPGHDFGKNTRHSLEATRRLGEMVATPAGPSWSPCPTRTSSARPSTCRWTSASSARWPPHPSAPGWARGCSGPTTSPQTRATLDMVEAIRGTRQPAVARRGLA